MCRLDKAMVGFLLRYLRARLGRFLFIRFRGLTIGDLGALAGYGGRLVVTWQDVSLGLFVMVIGDEALSICLLVELLDIELYLVSVRLVLVMISVCISGTCTSTFAFCLRLVWLF